MQHDVQRPRPTGARPEQPIPHHGARPKTRRFAGLTKKSWTVVGIVLALVVIGALSIGYLSTRNELSKLNDPEAAAQAEADALAQDIGRYLELPQDETPTVATVSDVAKLQDQLFFQKAKNGDRVLVFAKAQRAVLYRPSTKKVIEYAPISLSGVGQQ